MTDTRALEAQLFDPDRSRRRALVVLLVFLVLHIWAVWGYAGTVWSEHGRWLHLVQRFAAGQVPYRDFDWPQPPLALWIVGGLTRLTGADLMPVTAIMAAIAVLVFVAYLAVCARTASGTALPATLTGFVFATAYANRFGPPLPLGSASPSGPIGVFFLLVAIAAAVRLLEGPRRLAAGVAGAAAGFAVLTRFDLWVAAFVVVAWASWALHRKSERHVAQRVLWLSLGTVVAAGILLAFVQSGPMAVHGFAPRTIADALLDSLPSWERLTVELAATAALGIAGVVALWLCLALDDGRAWIVGSVLLLVFLSACAVHLGMTTAAGRAFAESDSLVSMSPLGESIRAIVLTGRSPLRTALYLLDQRFQQHLFPALMPPVLLAILLWRWRRWSQTSGRDLTLLLLAVGVALRLHRGFGGPDWYNVLVEIPAYAVFLHLVAASAGREAQRSVSVALAILLAVGCYTYYNLGRGPLTLRRYAVTATPRGSVRWDRADGAAFQAVDSELQRLDPGRTRPLLAFGPAGGWNYFHGRTNPTRFSHGFLTDAAADSVGRALDTLGIAPLIVDNRRGLRVRTRQRLGLWSWESAETGSAARLYQPAFDALLVGCRGAAVHVESIDVVVHDCPVRRTVTPPDNSP